MIFVPIIESRFRRILCFFCSCVYPTIILSSGKGDNVVKLGPVSLSTGKGYYCKHGCYFRRNRRSSRFEGKTYPVMFIYEIWVVTE